MVLLSICSTDYRIRVTTIVLLLLLSSISLNYLFWNIILQFSWIKIIVNKTYIY